MRLLSRLTWAACCCCFFSSLLSVYLEQRHPFTQQNQQNYLSVYIIYVQWERWDTVQQVLTEESRTTTALARRQHTHNSEPKWRREKEKQMKTDNVLWNNVDHYTTYIYPCRSFSERLRHIFQNEKTYV